jgi:hypothetical protein
MLPADAYASWVSTAACLVKIGSQRFLFVVLHHAVG